MRRREPATPVVHPDEENLLTLRELAELSGLEQALIQELTEAGFLTPAPGRARVFPAPSLTIARRAYRLQVDFDLDESGVVLALTLLQRIETLEARLRELECRLGQ